MKKVVHVLKSQNVAGAESHVFELLPRLVQSGYEVSLINFFDRSKGGVSDRYRDNLKRVEESGVSVYRKFVGNKLDFSSVLKILKVIEEINPHLVHTHMPFADLFGGAAAKWGGYGPVLSTRHQDYSWSWRDWTRFVIYYSIAGFFLDSMIAVSRQVASLAIDYEGWNPADIEVIPHGCAHEKKDRASARKSLLQEISVSRDSLIIGTVARLIRLKGHRFAVRALRYLRDRNINLHWLFVGSGPEYNSLIQQAEKEGVEEYLHFFGHREDIPRILSGVDIMVHPTMAEAFGIVLIEAMVQQTPIVASNVGAVPEVVVDGKTGILVPPEDPLSLANAVSELLGNPNKREEMGKRGRDKFKEEFSMEVMVYRTCKLYNRILSNNG
jgi:glycosyltransferase involved in cell wall biosynthesis